MNLKILVCMCVPGHNIKCISCFKLWWNKVLKYFVSGNKGNGGIPIFKSIYTDNLPFSQSSYKMKKINYLSEKAWRYLEMHGEFIIHEVFNG